MSHVNGHIPDNAYAFLMAIALQGLPLLEEDILDVFVELEPATELVSPLHQSLGVPLGDVLFPLGQMRLS